MQSHSYIKAYMDVSLTVSDPPSLESIYSMGDGAEWQYKLLEFYHHQGRTQDYDSLRLSMEASLPPSDLVELTRYTELRSLTEAWAAMDSLAPGTYDSLYTYLDYKDVAASWAKSILIGIDSLELDEPLLIPSDEGKRLSSIENSPVKTEGGILELFPNPAQDFITISYRVDRAFRSGQIRIINQLGQQLYSTLLTSDIDQLIVKHDLEPGYYILELRIDDVSYKSSTLTILK